MEYTLAPLNVRIVFYILLGVVGAIVLFFLTKKQNKVIRIFIPAIAFMILFAFSCSTVYSALHPDIKTITCTFVKEERTMNINPFSCDCVFLCNGENLRIELDALTRNKVIQHSEELKKGSVYIVSYEARENLVLGIKEE